LTPASSVFGRELRRPSDLLFRAPPDKKRTTTDYAADLVNHLHEIHNYACQHLQVASNRMKTQYDKLANCAGYQEGKSMWLYHPTHTKGKSPKLQSSWEVAYKIIIIINDVVYRIQRNSRSRMMGMHLDLAPYHGATLKRLGNNNRENLETADHRK
jgi:hypothetical protein